MRGEATKETLTQGRLRELFEYEEESGKFIRIKSTKGAGVGTAGSRSRDGYVRLFVDGRSYQVHRLAWLYVMGSFPVFQIDHIDGNKQNNSFANLRDVTPSNNQRNKSRPMSNNKTGFLGVKFDRRKGKYASSVRTDDGRLFLGLFDTPEGAYSAYVVAKRKYHETCTI